MSEIWKKVPSFPGVLASSLGRILLPPVHYPMHNGGYRTIITEPQEGSIDTTKRRKFDGEGGYRIVMISVYDNKGKRKQIPKGVAPLVCEAFHGPRPDGYDCMHLDGDSLNNKANNLAWGTREENLNHEKFIGFCESRTGENHPVANAGGHLPWNKLK